MLLTLICASTVGSEASSEALASPAYPTSVHRTSQDSHPLLSIPLRLTSAEHG